MTVVCEPTGDGLTGRPAFELARDILQGSVSSRDVVAAHIARLQQVQPRVRAISDERFEAAMQEAERADRERRTDPRSLGPLHGVPITVKECFAVQGMRTTLGLKNRVQRIDDHTDPLVARLRRAGAIVVAKTNVPQLMYFYETDNPVFGRTTNPWNTERVAGGSSGGEGAAIAVGGSPLGLGSDLAGSIRLPSHFCGTVGFRPTSGRLEYAHLQANFRGFDAISVQPGPMARCVEDIAQAMRILCVEETETMPSVTAPPVPWTMSNPGDVRGLRIGICDDDGTMTPCAAAQRAVAESAAILSAAGGSPVPFAVPDARLATQIALQLMSADGGADLRRLLAGERPVWQIRQVLAFARWPAWSRRLGGELLSVLGQTRTRDTIRWTAPLNADRYWQWVLQRDQYRQRFWDAWRNLRLDALVCPVYVTPAFRHGQSADLWMAASYLLWPVLLGGPAGVVPITRVRASEATGTPRDRRDWVERAIARAESESVGLPIGVQVLAPPWREEVALRVMQSLEVAAGF